MLRVTYDDIASALAEHADCLANVGITYNGRLAVEHGNKTYGRAYHLYLTDKLVQTPIGEHRSSGYYDPPIGYSFLGWTSSEAYDALIGRTRDVYDTARLLAEQSRKVVTS